MRIITKNAVLRLTFGALFGIILTTNSFGQTNYQHLETVVSQSALIVEGEVTATESFWDENHTRIYTSNLVEVKTKMKGELRSQFIEVLTVGGQVDDDFLMVSHNVTIGKGWKGLLFLNTTEVEGERTNSFSTSADPSYRIWDRATYYYDRINPPSVFGHTRVKDIESELLQPIERFAGQPKHVYDSNFQRPSNQLEQAARDFIQNIEFAPSDPETAASSNTTIEYLIDNPQITGTWPKYLEFDLTAKCNVSGTDFAKGEIWVNYNINAFGPSIVGSGYLTWTEESFLATGDYTVFAEDLATDKVKLKVEHTGALALADLNELPEISEALLHLKMRVEDLTLLADITFEQDSMDEKSKYRDAGRANALYPYDIVIAVDEQTALLQSPDPQDIEYSFANEQVIEVNGINWFQTDVLVRSLLDTTLLVRSNLDFDYNSAVFPNMGDTANWEMLPAGLSASVPQVVIDNNTTQSGGNILQVNLWDSLAIGLNYQSWPQVGMYIHNDWQLLARLRMRIENCNEVANVSFHEAAIGSTFWDEDFIVVGQQLDTIYLFGYLNIIALDTFNSVVCPDSIPVIYSFSPKSVSAGTHDTLTINGVNFGDSAVVWFRSAEISTDTIYMETMDPHYISKSDSVIKLLVPSVQFTDTSAATGLFLLQTAQGDTAWTDEQIEVRYSALNYRPFLPTVRRSILINQDSLLNSPGNGGYVFLPNDTLASDPDAVISTEAAIALWRCATHANFSFDPSTSHNVFEYDSINTIALVDSTVFMSIPGLSIPGNALAFTWGKRLNCVDYNLAESMVAIMDIDILVNKDYNWNRDTSSSPSSSEFDLYSVLIHEVGHGLMLGHTLNPDDVMNPSIAPGETNRVLSGFDVEGGNYCIELSATSHFDASGSVTCPTPMIPDSTDCGAAPQGIAFTSQSSTELSVWPNPSNGTFRLNCDCDGSSIALSVVDLSGKQVYSDNDLKCSETTASISMKGIGEGIYVLRTTCEKDIKSTLICVLAH